MSLKEAVSSIADALEEYVLEECVNNRVLKGFVRELRTAVKASGSDYVKAESPQQSISEIEAEIRRAAKEEAAANRKAKLQEVGKTEEGIGAMVSRVEGGRLDGELVPTECNTPDGAKSNLCNGREVYIFHKKDNKWKMSEIETSKFCQPKPQESKVILG